MKRTKVTDAINGLQVVMPRRLTSIGREFPDSSFSG